MLWSVPSQTQGLGVEHEKYQTIIISLSKLIANYNWPTIIYKMAFHYVGMN